MMGYCISVLVVSHLYPGAEGRVFVCAHAKLLWLGRDLSICIYHPQREGTYSVDMLVQLQRRQCWRGR